MKQLNLFQNSEKYEELWIDINVNLNTDAIDELSDDDYISYKLWDSFNKEEMYKKHMSKSLNFVGKNPNIIFHGGCIGCLSQRKHEIDRCKGCMYFRFNPMIIKPNLYIKGEDFSTL